MRFIDNGPDLDDELLVARDEGRVLFFCGAGVSQAKAHLPNFAKLAESVLSSLGSASGSPARRLFRATQKFEQASGLTGLVATDRIFGLLEQEFESTDVRGAVAQALRTKPGYGVEAHRTLLDLSRSRSGVAKIITTNFDLLFEECDQSVTSLNPPHLPDPRRERDFHGIIHLHGKVDATYSRAIDDEFVLSSADFGRAYLSEGWATRYVQSLIERYVIVFVGYSADDPPVQYLLEALSRVDGYNNSIYAFQAGDHASASERWSHKGVIPIPYDSADYHSALWNTLGKWAERARDIDGWYAKTIASAHADPASQKPFERGQIAHLAKTEIGAKHLTTQDTVLPPLWLFVLDPTMRYGRPGTAYIFDQESGFFDPFEAFGLDSDEAPPPFDPSDPYQSRPVPKDAWSAFVPNIFDGASARLDNGPQMRGGNSQGTTKLLLRQRHLAKYIASIAQHPEVLWWAAHQDELHPELQLELKWRLRRDASRFPQVVRDGWQILLRRWQQEHRDADQLYHEIESAISTEGWSSTLVRDVVRLYDPRISVQPAYGAKAPTYREDTKVHDIIQADVDYPRPSESIALPDEQLKYAVTLFRRTIEDSAILEDEIHGSHLILFESFREGEGGIANEHAFRLTGLLATYINLIMKLTSIDLSAARAEVASWGAIPFDVFIALKLWASSKPNLTTPEEVHRFLINLEDKAFCSHDFQRDLLFALRDRWDDFTRPQRKDIEHKLLNSSYPWKSPDQNTNELNAHYRLDRIYWLQKNGIQFDFEVEKVIARLRKDAPDWTERSGDGATDAGGVQVHEVEDDTNPTLLLDLPLAEVVNAENKIARRDRFEHVNYRPFVGLLEDHPARALGALTNASRQGIFSARLWTELLQAKAPKLSSSRALTVIALRLIRLSNDQLLGLLNPATGWLKAQAKTLLETSPKLFDAVWDRLVLLAEEQPSKGSFKRPDRNWVNDGLSKPVGHLADALFQDPALSKLKANKELPEVSKARCERLLRLPGDERQHALTMIASHLDWLFYIDPRWTDTHLLNFPAKQDADAQAFWDGYLWRARVPRPRLLAKLRKHFKALVQSRSLRREYKQIVSDIFLVLWGNVRGLKTARLSSWDLRDLLIHADEDFRGSTLWNLERRAKNSPIWASRVIPFLREVWPRQKAARTRQTAGRLVDLAFSIPNQFPEVVQTILPIISAINENGRNHFSFLDKKISCAHDNPSAMLDLLWAMLPEKRGDWPYGTIDALDAISTDLEVASDWRFKELNRKALLG